MNKLLPVAIVTAAVVGALAGPIIAGASSAALSLTLCVDHRGNVRYPGDAGCGARETLLEVAAPSALNELQLRLDDAESMDVRQNLALSALLHPVLEVIWQGADEGGRLQYEAGGRDLQPGSEVILSYVEGGEARSQTVAVVNDYGFFWVRARVWCAWTDVRFEVTSALPDDEPLIDASRENDNYGCPTT